MIVTDAKLNNQKESELQPQHQTDRDVSKVGSSNSRAPAMVTLSVMTDTKQTENTGAEGNSMSQSSLSLEDDTIQSERDSPPFQKAGATQTEIISILLEKGTLAPDLTCDTTECVSSRRRVRFSSEAMLKEGSEVTRKRIRRLMKSRRMNHQKGRGNCSHERHADCDQTILDSSYYRDLAGTKSSRRMITKSRRRPSMPVLLLEDEAFEVVANKTYYSSHVSLLEQSYQSVPRRHSDDESTKATSLEENLHFGSTSPPSTTSPRGRSAVAGPHAAWFLEDGKSNCRTTTAGDDLRVDNMDCSLLHENMEAIDCIGAYKYISKLVEYSDVLAKYCQEKTARMIQKIRKHRDVVLIDTFLFSSVRA